MYILLITFLALHGCGNAKYYEVKGSRSHNSILRRSGIDLNTLKDLARVFPNHAIEIQIQGSRDDLPEIRNKYMNNHELGGDRHFYQTWPYRIARSGENPNSEKAISPKAGVSNQMPETTTTRTSTTMTTMPTKLETEDRKDLYSQQPTDGAKRPLFMEDLIQALEDFEKKLATKVDHAEFKTRSTAITDYANRPVVKKDLWDLEKMIKCTTDNESGSNDYPVLPLVDNRNMAVKNFHDVVQLIKKGVKVHLGVTTPRHRDSNLKWVPIKIPKEII